MNGYAILLAKQAVIKQYLFIETDLHYGRESRPENPGGRMLCRGCHQNMATPITNLDQDRSDRPVPDTQVFCQAPWVVVYLHLS